MGIVQVFELASILDEDSMLHYPVLEIGINSKISSMCWNSYVKSCLLAADYEGAIQLWDVSANAVTSQYEEHTKRVWSVDFSRVSHHSASLKSSPPCCQPCLFLEHKPMPSYPTTTPSKCSACGCTSLSRSATHVRRKTAVEFCSVKFLGCFMCS